MYLIALSVKSLDSMWGSCYILCSFFEGDILNLIKTFVYLSVLFFLAACCLHSPARSCSHYSPHKKCPVQDAGDHKAIVHNQVSGKYYKASSSHSQIDAKKRAMVACKNAKVGRTVKNACVVVSPNGV